jgi:hypothetical protein
MKIRSMRGELFHAGGRTDMKKLNVAFRNFARVKNSSVTIQGRRFALCEPNINIRVL